MTTPATCESIVKNNPPILSETTGRANIPLLWKGGREHATLVNSPPVEGCQAPLDRVVANTPVLVNSLSGEGWQTQPDRVVVNTLAQTQLPAPRVWL